MAQQESGPFAKLFMFIGLIAGLAAGSETGETGPTVLCAIIFAAIGFGVGRITDGIVFRLIFIACSIISFLVNAAIRRFIWELIRAAVS